MDPPITASDREIKSHSNVPGRQPFSFGPEARVFGEKIKLEASELMNNTIMNLLGDGIMDFHGHVIENKITEKDRRRLWKYIQYLWIWNPGHEAFRPLTKPDGTSDSASFAAGVRALLGLNEDEEITLGHLVQFINDVVIDVGVVHPVLADMREKLRTLAPMWVMQPRIVMEDPNAPGNYLDLASSVDKDIEDVPVLKLKLT